jgi:6-phosphogluconolactonase (cycloisomerase 2 family)
MPSRNYLAVTLLVCAALTLAGCGTNSIKVCPLASCRCGQNSDVCLAPQFLYANGVNGLVTAFPIDNNTGALGQSTSVSTARATDSLGMAVLNHQFLYVSSPLVSISGESSIDAWSINGGTDALVTVSGSPFGLGPLSFAAGLATNEAANVLYVGDAGRIDALKADENGVLTAISGSPFLSGTNLYLTVDPQNRFLFASADDPPGSVFAFTIDSTGALAAVAGSPFPTIPNFGGNTRPYEIVVDSSGSFVYTTLSETGQIAAFSIVTPGGALNPVPGSPFTIGDTPVSLTTVNNFLYASNGTIYGYSIAPGTGVLTPLSGSPFPIHGGALTTDIFGRFLYVSSSAGIFAFTIDSTTGALAPIAGSPFPNAGATVLTIAR